MIFPWFRAWVQSGLAQVYVVQVRCQERSQNSEIRAKQSFANISYFSQHGLQIYYIPGKFLPLVRKMLKILGFLWPLQSHLLCIEGPFLASSQQVVANISAVNHGSDWLPQKDPDWYLLRRVNYKNWFSSKYSLCNMYSFAIYGLGWRNEGQKWKLLSNKSIINLLISYVTEHLTKAVF